MNTLKFSIFINAPKEKVWSTLLDDATYREWTKPFDGDSHYQGDWSEGSKMLFLGSSDGGMVSRIEKNVLFEYISIQHLGVMEGGVEKLSGGEGDGFENYILTEREGGTQLDIELVNIPESYVEIMNEMWPKALDALKALAEK